MRLSLRLLAVLAFVLPFAAARADSYQTSLLFYPQHGAGNFYGLDDSGNASIYGPVGCGRDISSCYTNFYNGAYSGVTFSPPFTPDNGTTACNVQLTTTFFDVQGVYCNGSKFVVAARLTDTQIFSFLYPGGDPLSVISGVGLTEVHINALGDILYQVQSGDAFVEAFDLTSRATPEPSSIALLGTGLLGLGVAVRRRLA